MIAAAQNIDRQSNVDIKYLEAKAESTSLDADVADIVTAGQSWHWFDRPPAIQEVIRVNSGKCWHRRFGRRSGRSVRRRSKAVAYLQIPIKRSPDSSPCFRDSGGRAESLTAGRRVDRHCRPILSTLKTD
ncbi:MAG: class I SAM-dependent methyltransferase [Steroidobacteraceae bacterium]